MIDVEAWLKAYLIADTTLMTLIGSSNNFVKTYPTNPAMWPWLAYQLGNSNNHSTGFGDDQPFSDQVSLEFNVYQNQETETFAIDNQVDALMHAKLFSRTFYHTFKEADTNRNRSTLRYARSLTASDVL